mgnify:CR=1 FL=1
MTAVVAVCENGGIGKDGALLFHIREDLRRFRQLYPHCFLCGKFRCRFL